jgi:hypothetical protein
LNKKQQNEHTSSWFVLGQLMNTAGSSCYLAVMFFLQEAHQSLMFLVPVRRMGTPLRAASQA